MRVLTCFDLHVRPYLKVRWGLLLLALSDLRGCSLVLTSMSVLTLRSGGVLFCEVWRNVLYRAAVYWLGTLLGTNLYLCFFIDEGGLIVIHPFWQRLEFWGINVTLGGGVTASLKNLVPLRKEKECSAKFLHC